MSNPSVATTTFAAIAGVGVRHDSDLRLKILSADPDWKSIVKDMCMLEGKGLLMADTVALFMGRCEDTSHVLQITSMIGVRPPVMRRTGKAN